MGSISYKGGHFRKLWMVELEEFRDHLLRLDSANRYLRFGAVVSDEFIEDYAAHALDKNCRIWGYFGPRGNLRGTGELKRFDDNPHAAEAAFTVESKYQGKGVGTQLFNHVVLSARNRDIRHLYLNCLSENQIMQTIARKIEADISFSQGDAMFDLHPPHSTTLSQVEEMIEDGGGLVYGVIDLQQRLMNQ